MDNFCVARGEDAERCFRSERTIVFVLYVYSCQGQSWPRHRFPETIALLWILKNHNVTRILQIILWSYYHIRVQNSLLQNLSCTFTLARANLVASKPYVRPSRLDKGRAWRVEPKGCGPRLVHGKTAPVPASGISNDFDQCCHSKLHKYYDTT